MLELILYLLCLVYWIYEDYVLKRKCLGILEWLVLTGGGLSCSFSYLRALADFDRCLDLLCTYSIPSRWVMGFCCIPTVEFLDWVAFTLLFILMGEHTFSLWDFDFSSGKLLQTDCSGFLLLLTVGEETIGVLFELLMGECDLRMSLFSLFYLLAMRLF